MTEKHNRGRPEVTYETIPWQDFWLRYYDSYTSGIWNISEIADIANVNRKTVYKYFRLIAQHNGEVFPKRKNQ